MQTWRLIPHRADCGATQMQIDQFLLDRLCQDPSLPPVLRFYSWQPAAISLGLHQTKFPDHWLDLIQVHGLDLVRRPTGGRGVLHQGDICYSLIANPPFSDRLQNYRYFCDFLIDGLNRLVSCEGLTIKYGENQKSYIQQPNCFAIATAADLVATYINQDTEDHISQDIELDIGSNQKTPKLKSTKVGKLVGSAQVYRQGALLQHGSILINPELELWQKFFGNQFFITGLAQILQYSPAQLPDLSQKLVASLCQAAIDRFEADLIEMPLTNTEIAKMGLILK